MSEAEGADLDIAKQRSPTYPYISLDVAVERIRKIRSAVHDTAQTREVLARAYGKPVTSSATIQTFATLLQYGLLETEIQHHSLRRLRVTNLAKELTNTNAPESIVTSAKKTAAMSPPIFRELWELYGASADGDDSGPLFHLTHGRSANQGSVFTEKAAQDVLRTYRATLSFAGITDADKVIEQPQSEPLAPEAPQPVASQPEPLLRPEPPLSGRTRERSLGMSENERELQTGMLSKTAAYRVIVTGRIGVKEIERLIRRLEMDKEILADDSVNDSDA